MSLALNRVPQAGGAAGSPFVPSDLASLTFWLDPDDATTRTGVGVVTTITDKEAGLVLDGFNSPAPRDSGGVTWIEFSGNANLRGRAADRANAAINFGSGELTIAMAFYTEETTTNMRLVNKGSNSTGRYAIDANRSTAGDARSLLHDGSSGYAAEGAASVNDGYPHIVMLVRDNTANTTYLYIDNVEVDTVDTTALGGIDETGSADFLSQLLIGCSASGVSTTAEHFTGLIGEVVFCDEALSASDRNNLYSYLSAKWILDPLQTEAGSNLQAEDGSTLQLELEV